MHSRVTRTEQWISKRGVFGIVCAIALMMSATVNAQVDSTPSIRAAALYYNNGAYTLAQATRMAYRYDMAVLGADAYTSNYYEDMVNELRRIKPNAVVLVYNSTDLNKVSNSKSTAYEWDSLQAYFGRYPHQSFYHSLGPQALTLGSQPDIVLPGVQFNADSTLSENGRFIGYDYRRHLNFGDTETLRWQTRFNKSILKSFIGGTSHYANGIWWDNCAVAQSLQQRETESPTSVIVELDNKAWFYDQSWFPSKEQPSQPMSATRLRFEQDLLPMLKAQLDTLKKGAQWHPSGQRLYQATNWAEVRFDVEWSPYYWRTQMYDSNYTSYAYMEHTPNPLKPAVFLSPGIANNASSLTSDFWSGKGPISYWAHDTLAQKQGVCVIYHPGFPYDNNYKPYGIANRLYSDIACYYLMRTDSTYFKIHAYNSQSNVGSGTGIAPGTSDSVMWVGAYSYDLSPTFPNDSAPFAYATSVPCTDCDSRTSQAGIGKDGVGQNWVVFRRNLPNGNMVLHRAVPANGTVTGDNTYTPMIALGGQFRKLGIDGTLGPIITQDRLRNGEGGIYITAGAVNNTPPTIPSPQSPTGNVTTSATPQLATSASSDPDNSTLTYTFQVSKLSNFSSIVASGNVTGGTSGTINWTVSPALEGSTTHWWRVRASDQLSNSNWSAGQQFTTQATANTPPTTPSLSSPPANASITQTSPTLVTQNASDVNGDVLTYEFQLYNNGGSTPISSASGVAQGTGTTSWTVPLTLTVGNTYQWRVRAFDGQANSNWTGLRAFSVTSGGGGNTAPTLPVHQSPAKSDTIVGSDPLVVWSNSFDADGDNIWYDVWLSTDSSGGTDVDSMRNMAQPGGSSISSHAFDGDKLNHGQRYWWRVRATDQEAWTGKTVPWSFVYVDFGLGTESGQATTSNPAPNAIVKSLQPTLVAGNAPDVTNAYYYFEVATDSVFVTLVTASGAIPEGAGGSTAWTVDKKLNSGVVYYWRVRADNNPFSPASAFTVTPNPHAAPSPFVPATHLFATFHDIPSGGDLVILTVDGQIVYRRNNIVGGTWQWDGTNQSSAPVASGVYLWYIEGTQYRGKLAVQR